MDGITDMPFRRLARRLGSAMSYTEFINAIDVVHGSPRLAPHLVYAEDERPLVYQIFDDNPERLLNGAIKLRQRNPDIIDVNMGCSARTVSGRGAGAGLLREPQKIASIFDRLTAELDVPVTGKIRLGWDENSRNYLDVARIIEDCGGKLVAVHARTREQAYSGQANWDAIAEVKRAVSIPVIGNGDVRCVADIDRMKAHTGCDAVMIGRAALRNPWIFSRLDREQVPNSRVLADIQYQLGLMVEFYGDRGVILMRKFVRHYLEPFNLDSALRRHLMTIEDADRLLGQLTSLLTGGAVTF